MTATDELRRMLNERGVGHGGSDAVIYFEDRRGYKACAYDAPRRYGEGFLCICHTATPEQAIDATLGRGTCRNVGYYIDGTRFKCSACGYNGWVKWASDGMDRVPHYCPNCGRQVIGG